MFSIINSRKTTAYGVRQFLCDTEADVANLPSGGTPGSTAYVIASGQRYILNHTKDWVLVSTASSSSGNGGNGGSTTPPPSSGGDSTIKTEIIYDGGEVI